MTEFETLQEDLPSKPRRWLVTGCAGFIGSNLVEHLLRLGQTVVGIDNLSTGFRANLEAVRSIVGEGVFRNFSFLQGDIRSFADCEKACREVDVVLHNAALGSVPRSIADPISTNEVNVGGTVNVFLAASRAGVKRVVYASSSSVYGDSEILPKQEGHYGRPLSPYAASKLTNELYASAWARCYGTECIGLRYFNVFGPRQDPNGAYAAVIPRWFVALLRGNPVEINGDGETTRDFTFVDNIVQINLLAATTTNPSAFNTIFNAAAGGRTSLKALLDHLTQVAGAKSPQMIKRDFRPGDVQHSFADVHRAKELLRFQPTHTLRQGLELSVNWYRSCVKT